MDRDTANRDSHEADTDPLIGTVLADRYRIVERLAAGGMGVVYRGVHTQLDKPVAVKFLHAGFMTSGESIKRFRREALTMSRLSHPNCVSVIDYGVEEAPFIVMDFVTGHTLEKEIEEHGRLPAGRAIHLMKQVLSALMHAHGQGLVHRDIKPENIMLSEAEGTSDHVFVLDFGLAKFSDMQGGNITGAAKLLGTPSYMSPEQTRGETLGPETDIYSAGVMFFELVTGRRPFEAENPLEVLYMHQGATIPRLRDRAPDMRFSEDLENVVRSALAKKPGERFSSAAAFANALDAVPEAATYTPARLAVVRQGQERPAGKRGRPGVALGLAATQPVSTLDLEAEHRAREATASLAASPGAAPPTRDIVHPGAQATVELGRASGPGSPGSAGGRVLAATQELGAGHVGVPLERAATELATPTASIDGPRPEMHTPAPLETVPRPEAHTPMPLSIVALATEQPATEQPGARSGSRRTVVLALAGLAALGLGLVIWLSTSGGGEASERAAGPGDDPERVAAHSDAADDEHPTPASAGQEDEGVDDGVDDALDAGASGVEVEDASDATAPVKVKEISDVQRLIRQGRRRDAIAGANQLLASSRYKGNTYLLYQLGDLYFAEGDVAAGLEAYKKSLAKQRKYRSYGSINQNIIDALGDDATYKAASDLYTSVIKRDGLRYLKGAASGHKNPVVRERAKRLEARIAGKR